MKNVAALSIRENPGKQNAFKSTRVCICRHLLPLYIILNYKRSGILVNALNETDVTWREKHIISLRSEGGMITASDQSWFERCFISRVSQPCLARGRQLKIFCILRLLLSMWSSRVANISRRHINK